MFIDEAAAQLWLTQYPEYGVVGEPIVDAKYFGQGFGIAVKLGNHALIDEINLALESIKLNGEYQRIYQRYFES